MVWGERSVEDGPDIACKVLVKDVELLIIINRAPKLISAERG